MLARRIGWYISHDDDDDEKRIDKQEEEEEEEEEEKKEVEKERRTLILNIREGYFQLASLYLYIKESTTNLTPFHFL